MSWQHPTTQDHIDGYKAQIKKLEEKIASLQYHINHILIPRMNAEKGQNTLIDEER